ncbi:hypothetical protein [Rhodoplanes sp. SY1]
MIDLVSHPGFSEADEPYAVVLEKWIDVRERRLTELKGHHDDARS